MNRSSSRRPTMTGGPRMMDDGPFGGPGGGGPGGGGPGGFGGGFGPGPGGGPNGPGGMNGNGRWTRGGPPPDESADSVPDAFNRFDPAARPATDARAQAVDALLHLLNPAQLAVWYDLTGRPFADADRYDTENYRRHGGPDDHGYHGGDRGPPPAEDHGPGGPPSDGFGP